MKKAFDWVDRDLLFYKLRTQFGIHGTMHTAIKSLYAAPTACVKLNTMRTDWFPIASGVKQGDSLSPTLFSMYLNDLAVDIKSLNCGIDINGYNVTILLYADDIVLLAPDETSLQKQLDQVHQWCRKWRMVVNEDKTKVIHFRPLRKPVTRFSFMYGNSGLEIVQSYKYLGVFFDEYMTFHITANALAAAAGRALGVIRHKLTYLKECRCATFTKLFSSHVCAIMDYCAGVWGCKQFNQVEQVQLKALRYFLGVHRYAPVDMLLGDAGWISCYARHKIATVRLWNRLVSLPPQRLTSQVFYWDMASCNRKGTWSYTVSYIFEELNLSDYFNSLSPCDVYQAHQSIEALENEKWNQRRYSKPKLRLYNMFKANFEQEEYITYNIPKYKRSLFAQFRAGILPLEVEVGRYRDVPLLNRLCVMCDMSEVEDEIHFMCECPRYADFRTVLFDEATRSNSEFMRYDNLDKFVYLMNNVQLHAINYVWHSCQRRRLFIYGGR